MSIRTKFIFIFLIMASFMVAGSFWSFQSAQSANVDFKDLADETALAILTLQQVEVAALQMQTEAVKISLLSDAEGGVAVDQNETVAGVNEALEAVHETFQQRLSAYHDLVRETHREASVEQIARLGEQNFESSLKLSAAYRQQGNSAGMTALEKDSEETEGLLLDAIGQATTAELTLFEQQAQATTEQNETNALLVFIGSIIFSTLFIILLALFVTHTILAPLVQLKDAAIAIGHGNLDTEVDIQSGSEVGMLGAVFNQMGRDLRQLQSDFKAKTDQRAAELDNTNQELLHEITERQKIEQTLKDTFKAVEQSKQLLTSVLDANPDLIFIKDKESRYTLANKSFAALLGLVPKQVVGKTDIEIGIPEELVFGNPAKGIVGFRVEDEAVFRGESRQAPHNVLTDADGTVRIFKTLKMPLYNDAGEIFGVYGIGHDITKLKQIEDELHQNNAFLKLALDTNPDLIFVKNREFRHTLMNKSFAALFGTTPEEATGKTDLELGIPEELVFGNPAKGILGFQVEDEAVFRGESQYSPHDALADMDGNVRIFQTRKVPLYNDAGEIFGVYGIAHDITKLKQIEDELHQNNSFLKLALDTNPDLIFVKDRAFRYTLMNKGFAALLGTTPEEAIGKTDIELGIPEETVFGNPAKGIPGFRVEDKAVFKGESQYSPHDALADMDGNVRIFHTRKVPLYNDTGEIFGVYGISHDITKLKQVEEVLRQTSLRFSNMVENVPGVIYEFLVNADGVSSIPYISPASKNVLGLEPEAVQNDATLFLNMPHPDDLSSFQETGTKSAENLELWEWTGRTIVNEQIKWIEGVAQPKLLEDGSILWDGLLTDITERRRLEDELQAYRLDLEARVVDRTERLMLINRISQELNNLLDLNKLLAMFINLLHDSLGLDYAQVYLIEKATGDLCLAEGTGEVGQQLKRENYRLKSGQGIAGFVASQNEPFLSQNVHEEARFHPNPLLPNIQSKVAVPLRTRNEVIGVLDIQSETLNYFSTEDISTLQTIADQTAIAVENARFLAERQATITKLKEADEAKSQFITMISHELRTPLNAINGFAELLLMGLGGELSDDAKGDIQLIYNNGQHLLQLINDVIDISQIESGQLQVKMETLSVQEVVETTLKDTQSLLTHEAVEMVAEVDDDVPAIWADSTRLKQILFNLVSNAIKFTHEGQITISASSRVDRPNWVEFRVKDTGVGIPEDKLEQIFDLFKQIDMTDARQHGGLGVGLSVCKMLVDLHGGEIGVSSEEGVGSEFWCTIPVSSQENGG